MTSASAMWTDRAARILTEAGAPWVWNIVVPLIIGAHLGVFWWGVFSALIAGVIPMIGILVLMRRRRVSDHHVTNRGERTWVIVFILLAVVAGFVIEIVARAPVAIVALTVAGFLTLLVIGVITIAGHWKISVHGAVTAGCVIALMWIVSPWWALAWVLPPLVMWSRVHLGDHTRAQVLGGAAVGIAVVTATFAALT